MSTNGGKRKNSADGPAPKRQKVAHFESEIPGALRGSHRGGRKTAKVLVRKPRKRKSYEEDLHYSSHVLRDATEDCVEVQILSVNNRWLLATNDNATGMAVFAQASRSLAVVAAEQMASTDPALKRHAEKLVKQAGCAQIRQAEVVAATLKQVIDGRMLTNPQHHQKLIVVTNGTPVSGAHAEQKLAYALWKSAATSQGIIIGSKRPCAICSVTLQCMVNWNLVSITNTLSPPGLLWDGAPGTFLERVIEEAGIEEDRVLTELTELGKNYTTHITQSRDGRTTRTDLMSESEESSDDDGPDTET